MAQLLIRDLPEALVLALKVRAAANGRSAEASTAWSWKRLSGSRDEFRKRATCWEGIACRPN